MFFPALFLASTLVLGFQAGEGLLLSGRIRCAGSETMAPLLARWADAFVRTQPAVSFQMESRGSATAIGALLGGTADVAALSRAPSAEEESTLRDALGDLLVVVAARDTLAWLVRADVPDATSGEQRPNGRVAGRLPGSGTRQEAQLHLGLDASSQQALGLTSPTGILMAVRSDSSLAGYGSVTGRLSQVKIASGPRLVRPLCLVIPLRSLEQPALRAFLDFLWSAEGRSVVRSSGFASGLPIPR